jgi:hypothetical protein
MISDIPNRVSQWRISFTAISRRGLDGVVLALASSLAGEWRKFVHCCPIDLVQLNSGTLVLTAS